MRLLLATTLGCASHLREAATSPPWRGADGPYGYKHATTSPPAPAVVPEATLPPWRGPDGPYGPTAAPPPPPRAVARPKPATWGPATTTTSPAPTPAYVPEAFAPDPGLSDKLNGGLEAFHGFVHRLAGGGGMSGRDRVKLGTGFALEYAVHYRLGRRCPKGYSDAAPETAGECEAAAAALGMPFKTARDRDRRPGCSEGSRKGGLPDRNAHGDQRVVFNFAGRAGGAGYAVCARPAPGYAVNYVMGGECPRGFSAVDDQAECMRAAAQFEMRFEELPHHTNSGRVPGCHEGHLSSYEWQKGQQDLASNGNGVMYFNAQGGGYGRPLHKEYAVCVARACAPVEYARLGAGACAAAGAPMQGCTRRFHGAAAEAHRQECAAACTARACGAYEFGARYGDRTLCSLLLPQGACPAGFERLGVTPSIDRANGEGDGACFQRVRADPAPDCLDPRVFCADGAVRLGSFPSGALRILQGGAWRPVCGAGFWDSERGAELACQAMGYHSGALASDAAQGEAPELFAAAVAVGECTAGDKSLKACSGQLGAHIFPGDQHCTRNEVGCGQCAAGKQSTVQVFCTGPNPADPVTRQCIPSREDDDMYWYREDGAQTFQAASPLVNTVDSHDPLPVPCPFKQLFFEAEVTPQELGPSTILSFGLPQTGVAIGLRNGTLRTDLNPAGGGAVLEAGVLPLDSTSLVRVVWDGSTLTHSINGEEVQRVSAATEIPCAAQAAPPSGAQDLAYREHERAACWGGGAPFPNGEWVRGAASNRAELAECRAECGLSATCSAFSFRADADNDNVFSCVLHSHAECTSANVLQLAQRAGAWRLYEKDGGPLWLGGEKAGGAVVRPFAGAVAEVRLNFTGLHVPGVVEAAPHYERPNFVINYVMGGACPEGSKAVLDRAECEDVARRLKLNFKAVDDLSREDSVPGCHEGAIDEYPKEDIPTGRWDNQGNADGTLYFHVAGSYNTDAQPDRFISYALCSFHGALNRAVPRDALFAFGSRPFSTVPVALRDALRELDAGGDLEGELGLAGCQYEEIRDTVLAVTPLALENAHGTPREARFTAAVEARDACTRDRDCVGIVYDWGSPPYSLRAALPSSGDFGSHAYSGATSWRKFPPDCTEAIDALEHKVAVLAAQAAGGGAVKGVQFNLRPPRPPGMPIAPPRWWDLRALQRGSAVPRPDASDWPPKKRHVNRWIAAATEAAALAGRKAGHEAAEKALGVEKLWLPHRNSSATPWRMLPTENVMVGLRHRAAKSLYNSKTLPPREQRPTAPP